MEPAKTYCQNDIEKRVIKMSVYGYMRVSTIGQLKGNSIEEQKKLLEANGVTHFYQDAYTGTKTDRPQFNELLSVLQKGDTLVVTKLDRFARNVIEGMQVIQELLKRGVRVHILNMGLVDNTPTGKLVLTVMLGFAEFERDMIVQRTQEGKAIAKTREGYTEGRPIKHSEAQKKLALDLLKNNTYKEVSEMVGISERTLYRYKNGR